MTSPDTPRHKPGTAYSCDARRYGADKNLCALHAAAEEMRAMLALIAASNGIPDDMRADLDALLHRTRQEDSQ